MSGQTSGSISLDLSSVAGAVAEALEPMIGQVNGNLERVVGQVNGNLERLAGLLASVALDEQAAVDALTRCLPGWVAQEDREIADYLAEHLAQAGYALVAVAGPALEREVRRNGFRGVSTGVAPVVDPDTAKAIREDEWFADGRVD